MDNSFLSLKGKELEEYQKRQVSQCLNSDKATQMYLGCLCQKQLSDIIQQQNFYLVR